MYIFFVRSVISFFSSLLFISELLVKIIIIIFQFSIINFLASALMASETWVLNSWTLLVTLELTILMFG